MAQQFLSDIRLGDNIYIRLGDATNGDLHLHHNSVNSFIQNSNGNLYIDNDADDADIYLRSDNGSGGKTAYFYLDGSAVNTRFVKDIKFSDSVKALFGGSSDLQIYHDGSNSWVRDTNEGNLYLDTNGDFIALVSDGSFANGKMGLFYKDGAVELYHNNSKKFETDTNGVEIIGGLGVGRYPSPIYGIYQEFNSTDANTDNKFAYFIDGNFSGADNTDGDREQGGIKIDIDSTADGDNSDEHRLYGVWSDIRYSGLTDVTRGIYTYTENNNSTGSEVTAETTAMYASSVSDGTSATAGTNNLRGVYGQAVVQNGGYAFNSYGVFGIASLSTNRSVNTDAITGTRGEVAIDSTNSFTLTNARAMQAIVDINSTTPTITNSYLLYGGYEGDTSSITNKYGLYLLGSDNTNRLDGVTMFQPGTAAAPSITRLAEKDTGIYFPATDTIGFTTGGTERLRINSSGINVTGTITGSGVVNIANNLSLTGDSRILNLAGGSTTNSQSRVIIGEQGTYGVSFRWDSSSSLQFDGFWNSSVTGSTNRDLGAVNVNTKAWTFNDTVSVSSSVTAGSFVKSGGTSSQFLMADGSVSTSSFNGGTITNDLLFNVANQEIRFTHDSDGFITHNVPGRDIIFKTTQSSSLDKTPLTLHGTGGGATFGGEVFTEQYFETDSGQLLSLNEDSWTSGNQQHYVLYNGWRSNTGDYLLVKSSGNQAGGNGAILIADGGKVYFGKHANASLAVDSATAPLDTTYAYIGDTATYFSSDTTFGGDITVEGGHQKILVGAYSNYAAASDRLYIGGDGLASTDAAIYIGNRGNGTGYGYRIYYEGTGSGNNNKLILKSENLGTNVDMLSFTADGNATFANNVNIPSGYVGRDSHNGVYFSTDDSIIYRVADSHRFRMDSTAFRPYTDSTYDLGTASVRWANIYTDAISVLGQGTFDTINTGQGATEVHLMNQNVRTTDNVQFGDLTVTGNLTVTGTSTSVNVEDLNVEQGEITLNYAASSDTSSSANGAGIRIQDAVNATTDATMLWNATDDRFVFSNTIQAPGLRSTTSNSFTGGMSSFETTLTNNDDWQNSPISILERGNVNATQTADKYSPNLNFHWGGIVSRSLWMDHDGHLHYGEYSTSGIPDDTSGHFLANEVRASILRDKDSTGYYLDPANTGTSLNVAGQVAGKSFKAEGNNTDQYFYEGVRTGVGTTLRIYDNSSDIYYDSWDSMTFRANQNGGSGGAISFTGGNVNIQRDLTIGTGSTHNGALTIRSKDSSSVTRQSALKFNIAGTDTVGLTLHNNTSGIATNTLIFDWAGSDKIFFYGNGHITTVDNVTAKIFRDYDNTAYYLDPSNTGTSLNVAGKATFGGNVRIPVAWDSGTLENNAIYAKNSTDGFGFGNGTGISTWWAWSTENGLMRMIDVANSGAEIDLRTGNNDRVLIDSSGLTMQNNGDINVGNLRIVGDNDSADQGTAWIRSNGNYIVINPVDGEHLYLNWDVGQSGGSGHVYVVNNVYAQAFYDRGDTNYYLDPANTGTSLKAAGKVEHKGLEPTSGTNIDQIKEFSMTFQLSANTWTDTGIDGTDLATGTYVMQVYVGDYAVGGGHYDEYYSATISWFSTNTNDTGVDEIVVHRAGHAPTSGDVQFRTQRTLNADSHDLMLQVKHNKTYTAALDGTTTGKKMIFKFRRLI